MENIEVLEHVGKLEKLLMEAATEGKIPHSIATTGIHVLAEVKKSLGEDFQVWRWISNYTLHNVLDIYLWISGMPYWKIAEKLNKTEGTIRNTVSRFRQSTRLQNPQDMRAEALSNTKKV